MNCVLDLLLTFHYRFGKAPVNNPNNVNTMENIDEQLDVVTIPQYDDNEDDIEVVVNPRRPGSPSIWVAYRWKY